jgi:hypothetical protein
VLAAANTPDDLILDGNEIFFSNKGDSSVRKVGADGGPVAMIATGQARPVRLAGDGTYVYWSSYLGGAIVRTLESGAGSPAVIAPANMPWGIAVDSTNVYWTDQGSKTVMQAPKGGGTPSMLMALSKVPDELILVGSVLNVHVPGDIYQFPLPNGPATSFTNFGGGVGMFAVGGSFQYAANGFVTRWWDLTNHSVGDFSGHSAPGLGADSCAVYGLWQPVAMVVHPSDTSFFAPVTVAPRGQGTVTAPRIVVDATRVFWADSGQIYRALKPQ